MKFKSIEILGGGLAGLSLGLGLVRKGIPVTIYEAGKYPRHRVCGEFISGCDCSVLEKLGVSEFLWDAVPQKKVNYFLGDKTLRPFELPEYALGISRFTLDTRIAKAFVDSGGKLISEKRFNDEKPKEGKILAVGRPRKGKHWVGLKVHVENLSIQNDFEMHMGDLGYLGISRIETGQLNLCGLFQPRNIQEHGHQLLFGYLRACGLKDLIKRLESANFVENTFCVTAGVLDSKSSYFDASLRIGDAYACVPPFTGNGLAMALEGASLTLDPIVEYASNNISWSSAVRVSQKKLNARFRSKLFFSHTIHPLFLKPTLQSILATVLQSKLFSINAMYSILK
jgi:flavin-dependent dehydrogenase